MPLRNRIRESAIVTTSWDDGHPLDLRMGELLAKHGMRGTFYVPASNGVPIMGKPVLHHDRIRALRGMGMEIGSHSVTHANMAKCPDPLRELSESKERLEQILSEPVLSFCYPGGAFDYRVSRLARDAGYKLARTTVAFRTSSEFDPFMMPVTLRFYPRSRSAHLCQIAKSANFAGLSNWCSRWWMETDLETLVGRIADDISLNGGILHLWGHSWEIGLLNLWERLEAVLEYIAGRPDVRYLTNGEVPNFQTV
jgi:peptidoglycan-N-acetylglucosamine deacetylase